MEITSIPMTPCAESKSPMVLAVGWKVCSAKVEKTLLVTHVSWVNNTPCAGMGRVGNRPDARAGRVGNTPDARAERGDTCAW